MTKLFSALCSALQEGNPAVTVAVIAGRGSVPRAPGAIMLVRSGAPNLGTVGGGQAEYDAAGDALRLLTAGGPDVLVREYQCLSRSELAAMGEAAGGVVTLLFLLWRPERLPLAEAVCPALTENRDRSLLISYNEVGWTGKLTDKALTFAEQGVFSLKLAEAGLCYVFGGGHVSAALVPLLSSVGFSCAVLDERPDYASKERFPTAEQVLTGNLPFLASEIHLGRGDSVLIMTRGHQGDYEVLCLALRSPAWYIGMVGSRRKTEATLKRLREDGFSEEDLGRITTPVGLAIEAETPAEIAVSITAELIQKRALHRRTL